MGIKNAINLVIFEQVFRKQNPDEARF